MCMSYSATAVEEKMVELCVRAGKISRPEIFSNNQSVRTVGAVSQLSGFSRQVGCRSHLMVSRLVDCQVSEGGRA